MSLLEELKKDEAIETSRNFPGTTREVTVRLLSNGEHQDAVFDAKRFFVKEDITIDMSTLDAYEDEKTTQILFRSITDKEGNPIAPSVEVFRKNITKAEKDMLALYYEELEEESAPPFIDTMTEEDFEKVLDEVKKNPAIQLNGLSIHTLRRLTTSLASQLAK